MTTTVVAPGPALLGDARRVRRLERLITARAEATLAQALGSWGALKVAERCFATRAVTPAAIVASAQPDLAPRCAGLPTVLVVQDPTTLALSPVGTRAHRTVGLLAHTTLAVHPAGGGLGLWRRGAAARGTTRDHRTRAPDQKARACWAAVEAASRAALPAGVATMTIADREADLFALFAAARPPSAHRLIRAGQLPRSAAAGRALAAVVAAAPTRPARRAVGTLQVTPVTLPPPHQRAGEHRAQPVALTAIRVRTGPTAGH